MITAMQAVKVQSAVKLGTARSELIGIRSNICFDKEDVRRIDAAITAIDLLFEKLIPNEKG